MTAATIDSKYIPSDAELYDYKNLTEEDKATADTILSMRGELTSELIDEFLKSVDYGAFTKGILREQLIPFVDFLREKLTNFLMDFTRDQIDSYPVETYEKTVLKLDVDESFTVIQDTKPEK